MSTHLDAPPLAATGPVGTVSPDKLAAAHVAAATGNNTAKTASEGTVRRLPARQLAATDPAGMVSLSKPVAAHVEAAVGNNMAKTAKEETARRDHNQHRLIQRKRPLADTMISRIGTP